MTTCSTRWAATDLVQKRLGDGFYEQRLIREQVAQLTGYRLLDGFDSDASGSGCRSRTTGGPITRAVWGR
ncbi:MULTISPECIES: hypothetical protein [unclassified Variovorax]|uniref:hypothetical protein n=1 Tax=unclassified Variovorax TaxID=663243 RepID=UPI0011AF92F9|nr:MULTISPECIES: hypothetical protein [unclassified Variovorax]